MGDSVTCAASLPLIHVITIFKFSGWKVNKKLCLLEAPVDPAVCRGYRHCWALPRGKRDTEKLSNEESLLNVVIGVGRCHRIFAQIYRLVGIFTILTTDGATRPQLSGI